MTFNGTADDPSASGAAKRWRRRTVLTTAAVVTAATLAGGAVMAGTATERTPDTLAGEAVAASAAAEPAPATLDPAPSTLPDSTEMQNRLSELNTWIITQQPDVHANGYVGSVNDAQSGSTILLWHGEANQTQKSITEKAAQLGITVTVQQRKHSLADITRGQKALEGRSGQGLFANFTINSTAGLSADFDGIVIYGEYINPPAHSRTEADAALASAVSEEIGVTVSIKPGGAVIPA